MRDGFNLIQENDLTEFIKYIQHVDIGIRDNNSNSLLHYAIKYSQFDIANLLLERKINVNIEDKNRDTALHLAVLFNKPNFVRLLLKYQADINWQNKKLRTPIFNACLKGDLNLIKMLLENHANIDLLDNDDENILFNAVRSSNIDLVRFLLNETSLKISSLNYRNESLLHIAVQSNNFQMCDFLIREKIKVYLLDKKLENCLFKAVRYSDIEIIKLLVFWGAAIEQKNKEGKTVREVAFEVGKNELVDYFNQQSMNSRYLSYQENYKIHVSLKERNELKAIELFLSKKYFNEVDSFGYHYKEIAEDLQLNQFLMCLKNKSLS